YQTFICSIPLSLSVQTLLNFAIFIMNEGNPEVFSELAADSGLTEEILALIEEMRLKHEAEINLSKQLNIEPEFAKAR
ncbi:15199_t:CDS:2, partial [Rhizophagus irregularis]